MTKADMIFKDTITKILNEGVNMAGKNTHSGKIIQPVNNSNKSERAAKDSTDISTVRQSVSVYSDGKPAYTQFITHACETYDLSKNELPITTLRPIAIKSAINELRWIYQDQSNDLDLLRDKYNITWWDPWDIGNRTIGQRYGATIRKYDLMNKLLIGLQEKPYDRRHIIDMFQYADFDETKGLIPCAYLTLWSVRENFLDMTLVQRSCDYLIAGHINKMQYVALQMMVARHVGLEPGLFTHYVENLHIYDRHVEQAQELLRREPKSDKVPKLILNPEKKNFYDITAEDFQLVDYDPVKPQLKFDIGI